MPEIGSLTKVRIRDVWPNEAADLTPWLAENPDILSEALDMELELVDTEVKVGESFSADILFRVRDTNALVVVENMMGATDHDHLGKTITYASGIEAAREEEGPEATYAVLLAERIREEHRTALTWLNTHTTDAVGFFGVAIEVLRIGNSLPAPRLSVIVRPDDWARQLRDVVRDRGLTERQRLYRDFWAEFLPPLDAAHPGWLPDSSAARRGSKAAWLVFPQANRQRYAVARERVEDQRGICVEFCVEGDDMERIYEGLLERRSAIEAHLGEEIQCKETPKMRKIFVLNPGGISVSDRERWPEVREWAIKRLGDLRDAIQPHLDELAAEDGA